MDRSSRLKEIFFNNLLLLGFNKAAIEKEYRVTCDKNMFSRPNQKMFVAVTHFLFSKLKGKYVLPWPLLDKDHHRQFQKLTYNYLTSIALESNVKFPRFTSSLLTTCSGERFYELYVAFSSHVLEQEIKKNDNIDLILCANGAPSNYQNIQKILKIESISSVEKSQRIQKLSRRHFEELLKCGNDYSLLYKNLKSTLMTNNSKLQERIAHLCSLYSQDSTSKETSTLEDSMKKGLEYEKKVKTFWAELEKFLLKEIELWKYLCAELDEKSEKYVLDSTHIKTTVPDILVKDHSKELRALEVNSIIPEENEKPCLLRCIKLHIIALESYLESYKKGSATNIDSHCNVENLQNSDQSLNKLIHLSETGERLLSNVKESVANLQETLLVEEFSQDTEDLIKDCPSWNFSSKSFNERIKLSRSNAYLPFSNEGEDVKLSLLSSKSSAETGCTLNESHNENIFGSSDNNDFSIQCNPSTSSSLEPFEALKENINILENLEHLKEHEFKKTSETIYNKGADIMDGHFLKDLLSDEIQNAYLQEVNAHAIQPLPDLLFDIDFDYSKKPFKMRESWQLEDNLEATTLPDDYLID